MRALDRNKGAANNGRQVASARLAFGWPLSPPLGLPLQLASPQEAALLRLEKPQLDLAALTFWFTRVAESIS